MSAGNGFALRPSTVAAAVRRASDGDKHTLKLKYPEKVKRAIKAHAARKGLTVADYLLQLAKADGLQVDEAADAEHAER